MGAMGFWVLLDLRVVVDAGFRGMVALPGWGLTHSDERDIWYILWKLGS